jgi:replicative DNA helicase
MAQPAISASDRALPHNLEAERSILGAILIRNDAFNVAAELIDADDFFRDAHRRVFDKMVDLNERGQAIDLVTLRDELSRSGDLEPVGGPAYIASLADGVPRSTNVEHYARIVKERATLRNLIGAANRIEAEAYAAREDASVVLDRAEQAIFSIAEGRIHSGFVPLSELAEASFSTIEHLQSVQSAVTGVATGFADIDEMTAGLQPSDLVIVAARPSMGKTAFALNIGAHVGTSGERTVGVFSLEMSKEQLFMRMLTSAAQIDSHRFRTGLLTESDYGRLSDAMGALSDARVYIDDTPSIGVLEMRAKSRRLKAEHGLDLVVIDYLQLMQGRGRFENRNQEISSISRSLKALAKELEVPVVALSQLSRAPESRGDKRPQLSDLRESGALEQDADVVMFIFREDMYEETPENANVAEIIIGKQRNGPTGTVKLAFLKQQTRFENLSPDYQ